MVIHTARYRLGRKAGPRMSWWAGGLIVSLALLVGCATEPAVKKQKHLDRGTAYLKQRKYNEAILELAP